MNLLSALLGEHGPLRRALDELRRAAPGLSDGELRAATSAFAAALESHAELEDELLFEALAADPRFPRGPVEAMRAEHERIDALFERLLAPGGAPGAGDPQRVVEPLVETIRHHFAHEENVLFPLALRLLDGARLEELGSAWAKRRKVELGAQTGGPIAAFGR